jgi:uroporphyrin-3 C-methyltransferase
MGEELKNTMKKPSKNNSEKQTEKELATSTPVTTQAVKKPTSEKSQDSTVKKQKPSPAPKKVSKKTDRRLSIILLLIIALFATGIAAYDFWLLQAQAPINAQLINNQAHFETRVSQLEQQLQTTKDQLSKEVQARQNAQSERQAINTALLEISEKLGRSTVAWRMAEVEYLLTVANHRLTLAQDRHTAIAVFETADSRLKAIADPSLLGVRKKLASEITALRAMPNIDIAGLAVQIGSLSGSVAQLPLIDKKRLAVAADKQKRTGTLQWQKLPAAVWNDVKSLVQVRRHQQATEPLLPPKQAWFLVQNLQLKLEQAKLAVLQRNTALFVQSLQEVSQWLNDYFDGEAPAVISMQAAIEKIETIELQPALPDVSASLRELRAVMNARSATRISSANKAQKMAAQ